MGKGAAQVFLAHFFAGHGLDHFRPGDEHLGIPLHHVNEIGQRRAVYSTAGAGSHDGRNLGDHTGSQGILFEHLAKAGQGIGGFLDPGTAGIFHSHDGSTGLQRHGLDLGNLVGVHFAQRTAFNREILCIHEHRAAVHRTIAGDDPIPGQILLFLAEVGAPMFHKFIQFYKTSLI